MQECQRITRIREKRAVVGVIGLGSIGSEVARLGAAFGMHVIGVRRDPPAPGMSSL